MFNLDRRKPQVRGLEPGVLLFAEGDVLLLGRVLVDLDVAPLLLADGRLEGEGDGRRACSRDT